MSADILPSPLREEMLKEADDADNRFHDGRLSLEKTMKGNIKALSTMVLRWAKEGHLELDKAR